MVEHCPHCQRPLIKKPIKDTEGRIIWKNLFYIDGTSLLFFISIILLLIGFAQITGECKTYLADPCGTAITYGCRNIMPGYNTSISNNAVEPIYNYTFEKK